MDLIKNIYESSIEPPQGEVWFGLFDKYIKFTIEDAANLEYVSICAKYLNSLPDETVKELLEASIRYCNDFLEAIGEPTKNFGSYRGVLPLIYPSTLLIADPENGDEPVIHMELNCEWEPEHGMEWVIRNDKVLYVGAFNGEYPWAEYTEKESWNYA